MRVDTGDPVVRDLVTTIAATVQANGGFVHPELVVRHVGASLWLTLPREVNPHLVDDDNRPLLAPHPDAEPLLIVPDELYIPVSKLDWEPHESVLRYRASSEHLTDPQRTILDAMVDLFNAVDKVRVIGQSYPTLALLQDPELLGMLREARPHLPLAQQGPQASPSIYVMKSRLRTAMVEGEEGPVGYFMPMVDMLNHHPFGSRYRRMPDNTWRIDVHHPTTGDEVFVRYHRADVLGTALGLGYVERATRHISSVACEIQVAGMGRVRVRGVSAVRKRVQAPRIVRDDEGWDIAGLVIEPDRMATLRSLLAMPVLADDPTRDPVEVHATIDDLLAQAIAANTAFYRRLRDVCTTPATGSEASSQVRIMFAEVSEHQLTLLDNAKDALAAAAPEVASFTDAPGESSAFRQSRWVTSANGQAAYGRAVPPSC